MSFTDDHALCCDCDDCLCRGGGTPTGTPSVTSTNAARSPRWRRRRRTDPPTLELAKSRALKAEFVARRAAAKAANARNLVAHLAANTPGIGETGT